MATNNGAKLITIMKVMKLASFLGMNIVQVYGDSQLDIDCLSLISPPKNIYLRPIYDEIYKIIEGFDELSFHHI